MERQEWRKLVEWSENAARFEMDVRVQRKTDGRKDHLVVHRIDDKTGQPLRLGKFEIATREWIGALAKGWQGREMQNFPSVAQLRAVRSYLDGLADQLTSGAPRKTPASP